MGAQLHSILMAPALVAGLSACAMQDEAVSREAGDLSPRYDGIQTTLLEGDLVNFHVEMQNARDPEALDDYAECAAAQYALIRGFGFARHVRTTIEIEGETWRGDAVYTVSPALPRGLKTIDAEVVVAACEENQIPTV
jgi:hypothetical protein